MQIGILRNIVENEFYLEF